MGRFFNWSTNVDIKNRNCSVSINDVIFRFINHCRRDQFQICCSFDTCHMLYGVESTQLALFTCLKIRIKAPEKCVKPIQG